MSKMREAALSDKAKKANPAVAKKVAKEGIAFRFVRRRGYVPHLYECALGWYTWGGILVCMTLF